MVTEHLGLEVRLRDDSGKQACRKSRNAGFIPGVVYGLGESPMAVEVDFKDFERARKAGGEHSVIDLKISGGKSESPVPVIVRDEQFHPSRGHLLHVDFYRVSLTQEITSRVPLETFGEPEGQNLGGILEHTLRELEVRCLPDYLPEKIEIDVSSLKIGDSVYVRDIAPPEGVEVLDDPAMMAVAVIPPRIEEEEAVEEAEEAPEPERVGEEKAGEEEEEAEEKKE